MTKTQYERIVQRCHFFLRFVRISYFLAIMISERLSLIPCEHLYLSIPVHSKFSTCRTVVGNSVPEGYFQPRGF